MHGLLSICPTAKQSCLWCSECEMLLVTSLPCSTSFRCLKKQQSPSVSSRDSLLRMDGSGTITCWPVTPFGLINVPRPATTNVHTHTHTVRDSINHTPLWLQRMQDFCFPEPERALPAPPPSPWKYTNTQWHAIPEPKCTQTHTQPLQVACTEEGGSIVMKDTMKLGGSTPASQDLLPSHFQCVLHDSHREARAVTQPSPRTTPPEEILFNTQNLLSKNEQGTPDTVHPSLSPRLSEPKTPNAIQ